MKTCWYVEDVGNNPGRIYAIFAHEKDAQDYATYFEDVVVVQRTVFYGQPPRRGFNK